MEGFNKEEKFKRLDNQHLVPKGPDDISRKDFNLFVEECLDVIDKHFVEDETIDDTMDKWSRTLCKFKDDIGNEFLGQVTQDHDDLEYRVFLEKDQEKPFVFFEAKGGDEKNVNFEPKDKDHPLVPKDRKEPLVNYIAVDKSPKELLNFFKDIKEYTKNHLTPEI